MAHHRTYLPAVKIETVHDLSQQGRKTACECTHFTAFSFPLAWEGNGGGGFVAEGTNTSSRAARKELAWWCSKQMHVYRESPTKPKWHKLIFSQLCSYDCNQFCTTAMKLPTRDRLLEAHTSEHCTVLKGTASKMYPGAPETHTLSLKKVIGRL